VDQQVVNVTSRRAASATKHTLHVDLHDFVSSDRDQIYGAVRRNGAEHVITLTHKIEAPLQFAEAATLLSVDRHPATLISSRLSPGWVPDGNILNQTKTHRDYP
jgi:hypothetical protein